MVHSTSPLAVQGQVSFTERIYIYNKNGGTNQQETIGQKKKKKNQQETQMQNL